MIQLRRLRSLETAREPEEGRPHFVAAASGLVHLGGSLYVLADDEQSLARFPIAGGPDEWIRLLPGELPLDPELRKAVKADFETLLALPPFETALHGGLLALGSGSHPRRRWAALLPVGVEGAPEGPARRTDLQPLYDALRDRLGILNIEGAVLGQDTLVLLQRGTTGKTENALVKLRLTGALSALAERRPWGPELIAEVCTVSLPSIGSARLGFTDGVGWSADRILFTAVAEETDDPYRDGFCSGSAIGLLSAQGELLGLEHCSPGAKLEGLAVDGARLLMVADEDRADAAALLFETELPAFLR